jgi:hypothetical protein
MKKKKKGSLWSMSYIRTFLTINFLLSCFTLGKKKMKIIEVTKICVLLRVKNERKKKLYIYF